MADEEDITTQDEDVLKNMSAQDRRNKLRELNDRDLSREQLSNIFGVSKSQIDQDRRKIKEENIKEVTEVDKQEEVGSHIKFFKQMVKEAWSNYRAIDVNENARLKREFFRSLCDVRKEIIDLQFKTGLIPERTSRDWVSKFDFLDMDDDSNMSKMSSDDGSESIEDMSTDELEEMKNNALEQIQEMEDQLNED